MEGLAPYLPRLVVEWARRDPREHVQAVEGTAAFVDVSGFTQLSERLSKSGKAGAEELTEIMNATLSRLLDVAWDDGGGVLKFGGDALLLFFDGHHHETRAARAVFRMKAELRAISRPRTSAGAATLRMHAGIHSGLFHFFLAGDVHRELLLAGPAATATVHAEAASAAGEIVVSEATGAALPPRSLGADRGAGRLLRSIAVEVAPELRPAGPDVDGLDLDAFVPPPVRGVVEAGVEPEHRQATIAFLRVSGLDERVLSDPGATAAALHEVVTAVQAAALEHEVTFLETDIDADAVRIVLVGGVPRTTGVDEERVLRTVRSVLERDLPLPVAAGISRGRVFAGEVGTEFRRTYTILGATAAVAARLMARAQPGEALASADVVERSATAFDTRELEPLLLKGRSTPLRALAVGPVAGRREATAPRLALVDRERERAILTATLAPVRIGAGSLVELVAEPGMGKSRLVEEVVVWADDMAVATVACDQYEAATPYSVFRQLLRSLVDVPLNGVASNTERLTERIEPLAPELLPWLPLLAIPLDAAVAPTREADELDPAFRRARLHGVVELLLDRLLGSPSVLVFEDVHWMDEASADLLRHLAGAVSRKPWLVCTTRRPATGGFAALEGTPPVPALTLQLEPLPDDAAQELVAAVAGTGVAAYDVGAITERAGGNPLFLQELVAAARGDSEHEDLPESVHAVVTTRIDDLAPGDRALLRFAAVMGGSFSGTLVAEVIEAGDDAWDRLAEFVERDPYTPGAFRFRHALFRDAAYEGLSFRRRRELHGRAAAAYEERFGDSAGEHAELLSLHFSRAQEWERAYRYSLVAAARARSKGGNADAAQFLRRALDAAKHHEIDDAELAAVWETLGDVAELAGAYDDAQHALRAARRIAERDGRERPELMLKEGVVRERLGRYADAVRRYKRALRAADALEDEARTRVRVELQLALAGVRFRQGLYTECIDWCTRVVAEADAVRYLPGLAHAYNLLHLAHTSLGNAEREAFRGLALPIYEELGDLLGQARALNNMGIDAYYEGRWDDALTLYRGSREARERAGDVVGAASIANNIGEMKSDQGYYDAAVALFEETRAVGETSRNPLLTTVATCNLGRAAARAGRFDEAAALLEAALAGFRELGAASWVLETDARAAEQALLAGDGDTAFALATATLDAGAAGQLSATLHRIRGYALAQADDLPGAAECLAQSLEVAEAVNAQYEVALTLRARARLAALAGDPRGAEDDAAARTILARLGVIETPTVPLPL